MLSGLGLTALFGAACSPVADQTAGARAIEGSASTAAVTMAYFEPSEPRTNDILRVEARAQGSAGVDLSCLWSVNGVALDVDSCVLDGSRYFDRGDSVEVTIVPRSESGEGMARMLPAVEVANTPPEPPRVSISPELPQASETDLHCRIELGNDPDQDLQEVDITWKADGLPWTGPTYRLARDGDAIPAGVLSAATTWTCEVRVDDGGGITPGSQAQVNVLPPAPYGEDLVVNGDFENGNDHGWLAGERACPVVRASELDLEAAEGLFMLHGGSTPESCSLLQEFNLVELGFNTGAIDAGRVGLEADVWLAGNLPATLLDDQAFLRVRYLGAGGEDLGSVATLIGGDSSWIHRQATGLLPARTRSLSLEVVAEYMRGERNDAVADAVNLQLLPVMAEAPSITKLPLLQDYRQDAMRLAWETDQNLTWHEVRYAPLGGELVQRVPRVDTIELDELHFVHKATIPSLDPARDYDYQVRSGDEQTEVFSFRTAPLDGDPVQIAWVADNQNGPNIFKQHVLNMAARAPDLVMAPGDIVEEGELLDDWATQWFGPLEQEGFGQTTPVLSARGNHERHHAYTLAYTALPGNGNWYAFTYGAVFIVVMDTETGVYNLISNKDLANYDLGDPGTEQADWLEQTLQSPEAQAAAWRIVTFHNPPYTNSRHDNSQIGDGVARSKWVEVMEDNGVDMVISGHFHSYQRGEQNGIVYLVIGGGGGPLDDRIVENWDLFEVVQQKFHYNLMSASEDRLRWTTYDVDDNVMDEVVLSRP